MNSLEKLFIVYEGENHISDAVRIGVANTSNRKYPMTRIQELKEPAIFSLDHETVMADRIGTICYFNNWRYLI